MLTIKKNSNHVENDDGDYEDDHADNEKEKREKRRKRRKGNTSKNGEEDGSNYDDYYNVENENLTSVLKSRCRILP